MSLTGVGVLIIGIALLVIAVFAALALNNLAGVLKGVEKTIDDLPNQLDNIFTETGNLIGESNNTLADVNAKLEQLSPLFYIVGDVGNVTRRFSSSLVDVTDSMKAKTEAGKGVADEKQLGGLYGGFALSYYWLKKRKQMKQAKAEGTGTNEQAN